METDASKVDGLISISCFRCWALLVVILVFIFIWTGVFIKSKADETFDFEEELKIEFYKAVSSYMGSKFWTEGSWNPWVGRTHYWWFKFLIPKKSLQWNECYSWFPDCQFTFTWLFKGVKKYKLWNRWIILNGWYFKKDAEWCEYSCFYWQVRQKSWDSIYLDITTFLHEILGESTFWKMMLPPFSIKYSI